MRKIVVNFQPLSREWNVNELHQYDQIGLFVKGLCHKVSAKSSPNIWQLFGSIRKKFIPTSCHTELPPFNLFALNLQHLLNQYFPPYYKRDFPLSKLWKVFENICPFSIGIKNRNFPEWGMWRMQKEIMLSKIILDYLFMKILPIY